MKTPWPARASHPVVEPLEDRIAPAVITLSPTEFQPRENGVPLFPNPSAAVAHATAAVVLTAGDSLVFDPTGQDITMVKVSAGTALVFLTDLAGDGEFALPDLTGMAVSNGFRATFGSDVNGSIVTALDPSAHLATVTANTIGLQNSSIAGISVKGQLAGSILAGDNIDNVSAGTRLILAGIDLDSVTGDIETGTATNGHAVSFDGGAFVFTLTNFTPAPGANGGNIGNIHLAQGAASIRAGMGGSRLAGPAGAGGNIYDIGISMSTALAGEPPTVIIAGAGGSSNSGRGGAGGSITNLFETFTGSATGNISITAGAGGAGAKAGGGGAGGQITQSSVVAGGNLSGAVIMTAGAGGNAGSSGLAGVGGAIVDTSVLAVGSGSAIGGVVLNGGAGGASGLSQGGAGGALTLDSVTTLAGVTGNVAFSGGAGGAGNSTGGTGGGLGSDSLSTVAGVTGNINFNAGAGGLGQNLGGTGGGLSSDAVSILGSVGGAVTIAAGTGGGAGTLATIFSSAGRGGSVQSIDLVQDGIVSGSVNITAGNGGPVALDGKGGAGGVLELLQIANNAAISGSLNISAGNGSGLHYVGGSGGGIDNIGIEGAGSIGGNFSLAAGAGASGYSTGFGNNAAGTGGTISGARVQENGVITGAFQITAGSSGLANNGNSEPAGSITDVFAVVNTAGSVDVLAGATGGATGSFNSYVGGSITDLNVKSYGVIATESIVSGAGGSCTGIDGRAGNSGSGGSLVGVTIDNLGSIGVLDVISGAGGSTAGATSGVSGGNGGNILYLDVNSIGALGTAKILAGAGGSTSANSHGGAGGSIGDAVFNVPLQASSVSFVNGVGGNSQLGKGGNNGGIISLQLDGPLSDFTVGSATAAGTGDTNGGKGSSVTNIKGSIGTLEIRASDGGTGVHGGAGGTVSEINIDSVGSFVRSIEAGNGGAGVYGGAGGGISAVTVAGDIGDYTVPFGFTPTGMGGLSAGIRGTGAGSANNGTVLNVTADRIAAIVAGGGYQDSDYVSSIFLIHTSSIGADINGNGIFDFIKSATPPHILFDAADGDIPIDGLVIVKIGGLLSVSAPILELVQV